MKAILSLAVVISAGHAQRLALFLADAGFVAVDGAGERT
jgi:hypothetical protein